MTLEEAIRQVLDGCNCGYCHPMSDKRVRALAERIERSWDEALAVHVRHPADETRKAALAAFVGGEGGE